METCNSLGAIATIWLAVFGVGYPLVRRLPIAADDKLARAVWAAALGLTAIGWTLALFGLAGLLYANLIGGMTLLAAICGLVGLGQVALARHARVIDDQRASSWRRVDAAPKWLRVGRPPSQPGVDRVLVLIASISTLAMMVAALAPTISRAAMSGSLEAAKEISLAHGLSIPHAAAPTLAEFWFHWALTLDGPIAVGLLQWSFGLLAAGATALLTRELLGERAARIAATLFLIVPGVQYQLAVPTGELAAGACAMLALLAWQQATTGNHGTIWSVVAGCMLGTTLATETLGIGFVAAIVIISLWRAVQDKKHRVPLLHSLAISVLVAGGMGAGWYIGVGAPPVAAASLGLPREAVVSIGVLLFALAPAALWLRPNRDMRQVAIVAAVVLISGALLFPSERWWLVLCPLCSVLAADTWLCISGFRQLPRRLAQAAVAGLALCGLGRPLVMATDRAGVAFGLESRETYLLRKQPEFAAVVVANSIVPEDSRLLADDRFSAYLHCRTTSAAGCWNIVRDAHEPSELASQLRARGITHVLLAQPDAEARLAIAERDFANQGPAAAEPMLPLAEFRLTRQDASVWRYCLLRVR